MSSKLVQLKNKEGENITPAIGGDQLATNVPVTKGGTGATNAATARKNLEFGNLDYNVSDAEYNALVALATGTRLIDWIYPIGSIKTFATGVNPNTIYTNQVWKEVAQGRVLMGADNNHSAGTTVEAGLPNITGSARPSIRNGGYAGMVDSYTGAFYNKNENGYITTNVQVNTDSNYKGTWIYLDASRSNSIYGNSDTVQPPAYFIHYWQRTA